jgi:hypothetical protein
MNLTKSSIREPESVAAGRMAGGGGQKVGSFRAGTSGKRVDVSGILLRSEAMEGGGGRVVGKWTGFAHVEPALTRLGPDNSMQVVDFPHLAMVSIFWGRHEFVKLKVDPPPAPSQGKNGRGWIYWADVTQGSAETAWRNRWAECCNLVEVVKSAALRAVSQAGLGTKVGRLREELREMLRIFTRSLASQARHEMGAQWSCSLARNVVANTDIEYQMDTDFGRNGQDGQTRTPIPDIGRVARNGANS